MKLITNLEDLLETYDFLGTGNYATLSTIIKRLQEVAPEGTVLVNFKVSGDCDGIFHLKGKTKDGCYLYEFSTTVS